MLEEEKIPLFKKWSHWYALVVAVLVVLIVFFFWFTKRFS
jgi:hypothetical protein